MPSRARYSPAGRDPCRGRGLTSFPVAPRRLGRPRHSPALSSRFRRVSAGPRQRCPLLTASPPHRAPLRHGGDARPWKGPQALRQPRRGCTQSPLVSALGFGKGISARANPSRSPAVTGRKLHYKSFQHELYYGAAPHRFPQIARSFSQRVCPAALFTLPWAVASGSRGAGMVPMGAAVGMRP